MKVKMHDEALTIPTVTHGYPLLPVHEIIRKNYVLFTFLDDISPSCDLRVGKANMSMLVII